ncbi:Archaeal ribosomal protein S17P [Phytophthora cinnamomi]|uniref:Archaeal ribosomal protein S17P n=1 Tax=Phytophthora cinnamomi TaxID=4785 RepID=UPI00355980E5|nr:Archaeal ribosomal protein S17P [Phytophthora cinnamomi]
MGAPPPRRSDCWQRVTEKAYQKQQGVFLASKKFAGKKKGPASTRRWAWASRPQERHRGPGVVLSTKMKRTIIVRRDYLHFVKKYKRFEKRHKNVAAHLSPAFRVKEGDVVTIGQCRPLAKTVRFNVLEVEPASETKPINVRKQFRQF